MKISRSNRKDKKFRVEVKPGVTVHFGARGYKIKPGTPSGDSYCARSFGIKNKAGKPTRKDMLSPNYWSRVKWGCKGKKSFKKK